MHLFIRSGDGSIRSHILLPLQHPSDMPLLLQPRANSRRSDGIGIHDRPDRDSLDLRRFRVWIDNSEGREFRGEADRKDRGFRV
ncbi:hypothetical protein AHAS_Ahas16G0256700 [Arachis hypogaea]